MNRGPLDDAVARVAAAESRASADDERLRELLVSFAGKMRGYWSVPFLKSSATVSAENGVCARGWCVQGVARGVLFPRDLGEATARYPTDYEVRERYGLGVCEDGRLIGVHLGPDDRWGGLEFRWDKYVVACGWDVLTCGSLLAFAGLGNEAGAIVAGLTETLARTLWSYEDQGDGTHPSQEPLAVLAGLRLKRTRDWREWEAAVRDELAEIDDPVERLVRLVNSFGWVPKRCQDLVPDGTWDRERLLDWFLRSVKYAPYSLSIRRFVEGGFLRGPRWEVIQEDGWEFPGGSTQQEDKSRVEGKTLVVLTDGQILQDNREAAPEVGFSSEALRRMARFARLPKLPAHPDTNTVMYRDRFGHKSVRYGDGVMVSDDDH